MKTFFIASLFTLCLMAADTKTKLSSDDQLKIKNQQLKYTVAVSAEYEAYKSYLAKQKETAEQAAATDKLVKDLTTSLKCDYFEMQGEDVVCVVKAATTSDGKKVETKK